MNLLLVFTTVLATASATSGPVTVTSDVACPTTEELAQALGDLIPATLAPGYRLRLEAELETSGAQAATLLLHLQDPTDKTIASQRLPASHTCAATAELAAVMVATWLGDPPPPRPVPPLVSTPPIELAAAHAPTRPPRTAPLPLGVSLGLGVSSPGDLWAMPALSFDVRGEVNPAWPFYVGLGLFTTLPRPHYLSEVFQSHVNLDKDIWYRLRVGAEAGMQWQAGQLGASLGGGVGAGYLVEKGTVHHDYWRPDAFVFVRGRLTYVPEPTEPLLLWVGLRLNGSLIYQEVNETRVGTTPNSRYEIGLLAGFDVLLPL